MGIMFAVSLCMMQQKQQARDIYSAYAHLVLCFCLTALPEKRELALHGMKNPFSEKGKSGSAIALSFDQFQLRHVSFDHAIVDRAR